MTKRRIVRSILSVFLSLVLIISGFLPGMPFVSTVHAEPTTKTITPGTDDAKTGTGTMEISLTIKKTPSAGDFTFTSPTSLIYDGQAKAATVSAEAEGMGEVTVEYYNGDTKLSGAPTAEGTYTVKVNVAEGDDYKAATGITDEDWTFTILPMQKTMTITLVIKPAQTITASDVTATYGDTDKSVSASVTEPTTGGGAITYAVKDGSRDYIDVAADGKLTIKAVPPTDGKAYVIVTAAETDDYAKATKEVVVTISKATVTVTAKDQSIYVNGTVPDLSAPVLDTHYTVTGLVGEDALTTAPVLAYQKDDSAATPDNTTAGTYDIVASGASAGDNYAISYTKGTLTISEKQPATVTKAPTANTLTYNGQAQALVTSGEATGGEMQYALGTKDAATEPYTTSIPAKTDAGTYYVWYMVKGDENHKDTVAQCVTATIAKYSNKNNGSSGSSGGGYSGGGYSGGSSSGTSSNVTSGNTVTSGNSVTSGNNVTSGNSTDTTNPDKETVKNADGTVTVTEKTTGSDGSSTSTTTEIDASGNVDTITIVKKKDKVTETETFKIKNQSKKTVILIKADTNAGSGKVTIPKKIKSNGNTYKVKVLKTGMLKGGNNEIKVVRIKATKVKKVKSGAFNGLAEGGKIVLSGSKKQFKQLKKKIKKSGLPEDVKIKRAKKNKKK